MTNPKKILLFVYCIICVGHSNTQWKPKSTNESLPGTYKNATKQIFSVLIALS